jgi:hypothetical protein
VPPLRSSHRRNDSASCPTAATPLSASAACWLGSVPFAASLPLPVETECRTTTPVGCIRQNQIHPSVGTAYSTMQSLDIDSQIPYWRNSIAPTVELVLCLDRAQDSFTRSRLHSGLPGHTACADFKSASLNEGTARCTDDHVACEKRHPHTRTAHRQLPCFQEG